MGEQKCTNGIYDQGIRSIVNFTVLAINMDAIRQYNQQRLLVRLMETAKEFTILVAMLKLMTFISAEEVPRIRLVQVAASIRKTHMVRSNLNLLKRHQPQLL